MGVRITDLDVVCLYDSVSDTPFGPMFYGGEAEAEAFLEYLDDHDGRDARIIPDDELMSHYTEFAIDREAVERHLRIERVADIGTIG